MAAVGLSIKVEEGVVTTDPYDFAQAVALVRQDRLRGLSLRTEDLERGPERPTIDLSLLSEVRFIEEFGVSPDLPASRFANFDALYQLPGLQKLCLHSYKKLDLSHFPKLQILFATDAPGLLNLEGLEELRMLRVWKLRSGDFARLSRLTRLSEIWLSQASCKEMHGLDRLNSVVKLELSHCSKLESLGPLPKSLVTLRIMKCAHLHDLSSLARHPSLEFLFVEKLDSVGFVPSVPNLSYVGFLEVVDGNLSPILKSSSVRDVGFMNRKHHSHSEAEMKKLLGAKQA